MSDPTLTLEPTLAELQHAVDWLWTSYAGVDSTVIPNKHAMLESIREGLTESMLEDTADTEYDCHVTILRAKPDVISQLSKQAEVFQLDVHLGRAGAQTVGDIVGALRELADTMAVMHGLEHDLRDNQFGHTWLFSDSASVIGSAQTVVRRDVD